MSDKFENLDANERAALESMLYRCRALVGRIGEELRKKKPEHFVDERSLADLHGALPRGTFLRNLGPKSDDAPRPKSANGRHRSEMSRDYLAVHRRVPSPRLRHVAVERGANLLEITDVTGHRSLEMLKTYSRDAEAFVGHAGGGLL
jgi:hypothetical protein